MSTILSSADNIAKSEKESLSILFIGNSYTYYNSMPQLFEAMAENKFPNKEIVTKFLGGGGVTLKEHWEYGIAASEIKNGNWDFVVLQEQSMLGTEIIIENESLVGNPNEFFKYSKLFNQIIVQTGASTVFYLTWSSKQKPEQQKYLDYAYMTIAKELKSKIVPVGIVWDKVRENKNFDLYQTDGSHPSIYGSYLGAMILFTTIFDTMAIDSPWKLFGYELLRGGKLATEKSLLCNLPEKDILIMQEAVNLIFNQIKQNNGYLDVEKAINESGNGIQIFNLLSTTENQTIFIIILGGIYVIVRVLTKSFRSSLFDSD